MNPKVLTEDKQILDLKINDCPDKDAVLKIEGCLISKENINDRSSSPLNYVPEKYQKSVDRKHERKNVESLTSRRT